ncbi:arrestin domain-containing protein 2-like [Ptychodera flava]|uniref:arrestin domain-containing protein 2-like n=1 Tax=Ptychodera flava TaxID=63121 RepID=UPI00396A1FF3
MPPYLKTFRVLLDDNRDVFSSGDEVSGRVIVELSQSFPCKGMQARFIGMVKVNWSEEIDGRVSQCNAKEMYFDHVVTLLENDPKKRTGGWNLPSGIHRFPFRWKLPDRTMPSSYEGKHGHVRYCVRATIDLMSGKQLHSKKVFTMTGVVVDPNKIPNAKAPVYSQALRAQGCLRCLSRPLSVSVTLRRKAYVPGNIIPISVNLEQSKGKIHKIQTYIIQDAKFTAFGSRSGKALNIKRAREIVTTSTSTGYDVRNYPVWQTQMHIPAIPASGLFGCDFIDLQYYVKVEGVLPGDRTRNLIVEMPICIGSKPLHHLNEAPSLDISPLAKFPSEESLHDEFLAKPQFKLFNRSISIVDDTDGEDPYGDVEFTPKYAYFSDDDQ